MIKEALEYIVGLRKPELMDVRGETYTDKALHRVDHNPHAEAIKLHTLTSLIDYIKSGTDEMAEKMLLHVVSPTEVKFYSKLDYDREREHIACANAQVPGFDFNRFMDHESFCIAIQSKFIDNADRKLLLQFAGTVETGTVAQYGDDGVSQKATVKTGIASRSDAIIPSTVMLQPYRTFIGIDQPESQFIFRMKEDCGDVYCAIFEADGGAWRDKARQNIHEYLQNELKDDDSYVVIS